jgi:hypothetical protein
MSEVHLTNQQARAFVRFTEGHETGVRVEHPGEPWGADFVRFTLVDAEGNDGRSVVLTYAGVPPRTEGIPPEWNKGDDAD